MSMIYMVTGEFETFDIGKSLTKQSFKDSTDINKILGMYKKTGVISHLNKFEPRYGDFAGFDFFEAQLNITKGQQIFDALPSELRREFNQDPTEFYAFVNDPENKDRLGEVFPELAKKGDYFPDLSISTPPDALIDDGQPGGPNMEVEVKVEVEEPKT